MSVCGTKVELCNFFLGHKENLTFIRREEAKVNHKVETKTR